MGHNKQADGASSEIVDVQNAQGEASACAFGAGKQNDLTSSLPETAETSGADENTSAQSGAEEVEDVPFVEIHTGGNTAINENGQTATHSERRSFVLMLPVS